MRLFVSVDLPDRLTDGVAAVQSPFRDASGIDATDPRQAHLTLKFLGEVDPERLEGIVETLGAGVDDAGIDPFEVAVGGLGVFPSLEYISVVWLGIEEGGDELTRLHESVEERAVAAGFEPEDHEFTPHVTIARMEHAGGKERVQELVEERDPDVGRFRVEDVRLKESELTPDGPVYSTVERFEL